MSNNHKTFDFLGMPNPEFEKIRKENGWGLTLEEFREAQKRANLPASCKSLPATNRQAGKPLSITEAYILDSLWSDHCSYKHSKNKLKELIKENKYVFKSEKSDAGAVKIPNSDYCAVFKIESHNHPTLINPFDGAATGVGGVIRDIFAMGAVNLGVGASLRYGPKEKPNSKDILKDSMKGASEYCGIMGLPLIALDTYFEDSFKHNCLMNVIALGIVRKDELIPNTVSKSAVGYNLIYIGKPTAGAAVGGASFASQAFEEGKSKEIEFGSNPLLEKVTFDVFEKIKKELKRKKLFSEISLKDMGAAGLTCSTVEQVVARGYGVEIYTNKVPIPKGLKVAPLALAVGEDQERNMIIASEKAAKVILDILGKDEAFKKYGGTVAVIGKVIKEDRFIMRDENTVYSDMPASVITEAPVYKPTSKKTSSTGKKFNIEKPKDLEKTILKLVGSKNVYSRKDVHEVLQGKPASPNTVHQGGQPNWILKSPDETDVCVIAPLKNEKVNKQNKKIGVALVFGGKSIHGRNGTPEEQSYLSVILGRLKLAVSGLKPIALTDGCNYGNPDNPQHYYSFEKGIDGLNKACSIPLYKEKESLAVVSGNVSLKNTYISQGKEKALDPSLVPAVFGYIKNYDKVVTNGLKNSGNILYLVGERKHEFKGSEYAMLHGQLGRNLPSISPREAGNLEYAALEAIENCLIESSAIIENGGLAAALTRMISTGKKGIGVELEMGNFYNMREDYALFSESIGYVIEVKKDKERKLKELYRKYGIKLIPIGKTKDKTFSVWLKEKKLFEIPINKLRKTWLSV